MEGLTGWVLFLIEASIRLEWPEIFIYLWTLRRSFHSTERGEEEENNPKGMIINPSFINRITHELKLEFQRCKFRCKYCSVHERRGRIFLGYWYCAHSGCHRRVAISAHWISFGVIQICARWDRNHGGLGHLCWSCGWKVWKYFLGTQDDSMLWVATLTGQLWVSDAAFRPDWGGTFMLLKGSKTMTASVLPYCAHRRS